MRGAALALLATNVAQAGILFSDIRPRSYKRERDLDIHVGNLFSPYTLTTHDMYYLNYCESVNLEHSYADQNVEDDETEDFEQGVTMWDTDLHESFFQYKMQGQKFNARACERSLSDFQIDNFKDVILNNYHYRLFLDGLPSATVIRDPETGHEHTDYQSGIPVGKLVYDETGADFKYILYNHWNFVIKTAQVEQSLHYRIIGFTVEPRSYSQNEVIEWTWNGHKPLYLDDLMKLEQSARKFDFTYSVVTISDKETAWEHRWEHYLKTGNEHIHLAAILLSLLIIIGLMCILSGMMKRGLNSDFMNFFKNRMSAQQRRQERAQRLPQEDEAGLTNSRGSNRGQVEKEDVAWKKVHGDVMRSPGFPNIMACFMGAGFQLTACFFTTLLAIILAFANTTWRPYIYTTLMVIMAIFGFLNGYVTSRYLKYFGTTDWNFSASVSAFALPCFIMGALGLEQIFAWLSRSSLRYSFGNTVLRVLGWYLLNGTMCYYGAFKGYVQKATPVLPPLGKVIRPIPVQPYHMSIFVIAPVFGFIQFAAIYAEFSYLLDSIFKSHIYAMFGFLLINFFLQVLIIGLLSCIQTYMQLCYQNYEWWWRSFIVGASCAIYIAAYAIWYLATQMKLSDIASDVGFLIYLYVFIGCYVFASGAISVQFSYMFVSRIYSNQRND